MKEFALKHPIITFLLADTLICGIVNAVKCVCMACGKSNNSGEYIAVRNIEPDTEDDAE